MSQVRIEVVHAEGEDQAVDLRVLDGLARVVLAERFTVVVDGEERTRAFTCQRCFRTSYNPNDFEHGYCGGCHALTGSYSSEGGVMGRLG